MNAVPLLDVQNVSQAFSKPDGDQLVVLEGVNVTLREGEIVGLLGRSGSGKSTLLRVIAGLNLPTVGEVRYLGKSVEGPADGIAMVFQGFALFLGQFVQLVGHFFQRHRTRAATARPGFGAGRFFFGVFQHIA